MPVVAMVVKICYFYHSYLIKLMSIVDVKARVSLEGWFFIFLCMFECRVFYFEFPMFGHPLTHFKCLCIGALFSRSGFTPLCYRSEVGVVWINQTTFFSLMARLELHTSGFKIEYHDFKQTYDFKIEEWRQYWCLHYMCITFGIRSMSGTTTSYSSPVLNSKVSGVDATQGVITPTPFVDIRPPRINPMKDCFCSIEILGSAD